MCSEINRGVKRRGFDDVQDDFSHFSLLQVPRKSRRLDCQFTPRYEVSAVNFEVGQRLWQDPYVTSCTAVHDDVPVIDAVSLYNRGEDRALAPFQPVNLLKSPSSPILEIKVHPDLVDDLRSKCL
uniref:Uncharacterized protein n=1 Tax=Kalanchoe fedtschenkoi TaxID=63787 RepID=A0A7N0TXM3_KALFE